MAMWVRMTGGNGTRRIFATGSYTNSTDGPGILMQYHEPTENLRVCSILFCNHLYLNSGVFVDDIEHRKDSADSVIYHLKGSVLAQY